jgi:hypothetical protein
VREPVLLGEKGGDAPARMMLSMRCVSRRKEGQMSRARPFLGLAIILVFVFVFVPISSYTWAQCAQEDLKGTWRIYVIGEDPTGVSFWIRSKLIVRANGNIRSGTAAYDNTGRKLPVSGGNLTVGANCIVKGTIKAVNNQLVITIEHAALDREKTHIDGVAVANDGSIALFSAVKK